MHTKPTIKKQFENIPAQSLVPEWWGPKETCRKSCTPYPLLQKKRPQRAFLVFVLYILTDKVQARIATWPDDASEEPSLHSRNDYENPSGFNKQTCDSNADAQQIEDVSRFLSRQASLIGYISYAHDTTLGKMA